RAPDPRGAGVCREADATSRADDEGGRPAPPRRRLERRGRDGHRRGDGDVQLLEPHGLGSGLGAEPGGRTARPVTATRIGLLATVLLALTAPALGSAATDPVRTLNSTRVVRPGGTATLAVVRGVHYHLLGWLRGSCSASGAASARYRLSSVSTDTLVRIRGRGVSRHAHLSAPERSIAGGVAGAGTEHWRIAAGGEPEDVAATAAIAVRPAGSSAGSCRFQLRGTVVIREH